jgi:predicted Rossmann fold nucleotide-binding protein DprA/Smf involved in DNA uptake
MKLAVIGSRSITDKDWVFKQIHHRMIGCYDDNYTIISGGAEGVDSLVRDFCKTNGLDFIMFQPYFLLDKQAEFSSRHFFTRNRQIVFNADEVLVLWDGVSRGTKYTADYAKKTGKPVTVIEYKKED